MKARLKTYAHPLSIERTIGAALFVVSLIKVVTIFGAESANPAVRVTSILAFAFAVSFLVLETLVWSLAVPSRGYAVDTVPAENMLELLRRVDPGDNPFTFPTSGEAPSGNASEGIIELAPTSAQGGVSSHPAAPPPVPWNKAVAVCAASVGLLGPVLWVYVLSGFWAPGKPVVALASAGLAFLGVRLLAKVAARVGRTPPWATRMLRVVPLPLQRGCEWMSLRLRERRRGSNGKPGHSLVHWAQDRATTVNFFSAGWIVVVCIYFTRLFPEHSLEGMEGPLAKPMWLDWLG